MTKQKRSKVKHFLDTTPDETTASYALIGDGVTELSMEYNPNTVTEQYIHQDNASTQTESYAPKVPVTQKVWPTDDVYDFIDSLRQAGPAVLAAAASSIVEVRLYETPDTPGTSYPATKWPCSIEINTFGGAGGESAQIEYTINITGDAVDGDFNTSTLAFTATGA